MICSTGNIKKQNLLPDYKTTFKQPPILVSREFSVWVSNNYTFGLNRFGVVALKKHIRNAVARNKAKRIAREVLKKYKFVFSSKDLILVIKQFTVEVAYSCKWRKKLIGVCSWVEHFLSKN